MADNSPSPIQVSQNNLAVTIASSYVARNYHVDTVIKYSLVSGGSQSFEYVWYWYSHKINGMRGSPIPEVMCQLGIPGQTIGQT